MPVPATGRETFYRRLLELSFLTTADAAFAIDAAKDEVFVRALRRLSGLDYEEFEDLLDTVGRVADEWDDSLKREFGTRERTQQPPPEKGRNSDARWPICRAASRCYTAADATLSCDGHAAEPQRIGERSGDRTGR